MIVTPSQMRQEACQKDIDAALKKYGFRFEPYCLMNLAGMQLGINLVDAKPEGKTLMEVLGDKNG